MMSKIDNRIIVPAPEVQHVPTIFRRMRSGEIRIPAFQRGFSWTEGQILELLDSIYRGYPIGSLLLWRVESKIFKVERVSELPVPDVNNDYPVSFVLDGLQRLTSLYCVFHTGDLASASVFNVVYDLRSNKFRHFDPTDIKESDLPLSALFSPKLLLEEHSRLFKLSDGDDLVTNTVELQSIFQGYMLPTVTIAHREVKEVVEIFARINSTGTALGPVDFMRALTWSDEFDLTVELDAVESELSELGFDISQQTLTKAIAVVGGRDPIPEDMLRLREEEPARLKELVNKTKRSLECSVVFLRNEGLCRTSEFLPYEGQLLTLAKIFADSDELTGRSKLEVIGWFWSTSFNEELRGKPDHFVARMIRRVLEVVNDESKTLGNRLTLSVDDLVGRRLIRGKALSSALLSLFGVLNARSLVTGELIPKGQYLDAFDSAVVHPLFNITELKRELNKPVPSSRLLANIVVISPEEGVLLELCGLRHVTDELRNNVSEEIYTQTLKSQFLNENAIEMFDNGLVSDALYLRAELMRKNAQEMMLGLA